jgi:hypothetical protein
MRLLLQRVQYVLDPDDREAPPRRLTDDRHAERAVSWTADGSLLFASQRTGEWQVWRIEPQPDARALQVTRGGAFAAQEHAGALYFTRRGAPGLWKLEDGLEHQVLADLPADSWRDWCVDAEGIHYYRGGLDEGGAILTYSPESGRERIAARTGSLATTGHSRLPDGSFVFTRVERSEADIMLLAVDGEP